MQALNPEFEFDLMYKFRTERLHKNNVQAK